MQRDCRGAQPQSFWFVVDLGWAQECPFLTKSNKVPLRLLKGRSEGVRLFSPASPPTCFTSSSGKGILVPRDTEAADPNFHLVGENPEVQRGVKLLSNRLSYFPKTIQPESSLTDIHGGLPGSGLCALSSSASPYSPASIPSSRNQS